LTVDFGTSNSSPPAPTWPAVLDNGEVHVWAFTLDVTGDRVSRLKLMLNEEDLERAKRFYFDRDKLRFIVGRAALRDILARYVGGKPEELHFGRAEYGKPQLIGASARQDIGFNMSDSHGLGAVAVTRQRELGLDVELVRENIDYERIAAREFSPVEVTNLRAVPTEDRLRTFFEIWTCKEAYLKGIGLGLTFPLNRFAVVTAPGRSPKLLNTEFESSNPGRWSLRNVAIDPRYVACLAIDGGCRKVTCHRWPASSLEAR